jgi:hypothetical protein
MWYARATWRVTSRPRIITVAGYSYLGNIPPEKYERNYYAQGHGASTGDAANNTAA